MRVVRVLTRLNLGGPARQVLASDPLLVARGHEVTVFAGEPEHGEGDLFDELLARGVEARRVPGLGRRIAPLSDWRALRVLRRAISELAPDVIHTHASKAGALGRRAAWGSGTRTVHTFHGHVLEGYFSAPVSRLLVRHERRWAARTSLVLAVSEATASDLARLGVAPRETLEVVPPGLELDELLALPAPDARAVGALRSTLGVANGAVLVGVVGRLAEVKRPELALEVFAAVAADRPEVALVFIGDGGGRAGLESARRRLPPDVARRVHVPGAMQDMIPVLASLDVLLATSRNEGLPVAMIEAGAAGLPVVSTAVGGVPELIVNGVTGLLAAERDGLALALGSLIDDGDARNRLGHAARRRVAERHSAKVLADRLEGLYCRLLESGA